ncbi:MAG TPA: ATP synthase subunit I [Steroidobacteraceae bacterium]|nr:ATP synthase subunit I [Steroidobacteraceae bacterium]
MLTRKNQGCFEPLNRDLYKVSAIDLPHARRLAFGVVLAQAAVALAVAAGTWAFADRRAALSALLGGAIATVGSLVMAGIVLGGRSAPSPQRALAMFFVGEVVKVVLIVTMFVAVLKTLDVAPLPLLGTFGATFVVYWIALLARMPGAGGLQRGA